MVVPETPANAPASRASRRPCGSGRTSSERPSPDFMASSIAYVSSRSLVLGLTIAAMSAPVAAAQPPPVRTPEDAIAAVKRVLRKHDKDCKLDWSRIDAQGYAGRWRVDVTVRSSRAGAGVAKWRIGDGFPIASNKLARAVSHGCGRR